MGLLANVPTLSYIQWKNLLITYAGTTYQIENSHTNKPFIYWDINNPYLLKTSNIKLEEKTGLFYIIFNESGVYTVVPNNDIEINFSENPSRDAITEKIIGLSNNTKDQFVAIQVDIEGVKSTVAKCEEDVTKNVEKISTIEQKTDEINLEVQNVEKQYSLDKENQELRDNFVNAILDLQSTLGLFSSDMNTYMEDNKLSDEEKDSIDIYKEKLNEKRNNINTQLDIIIEKVVSNNELNEDELILLNSAKEDINISIDNLLTNIDTVCVDDIFTNTEITAIVNYFGKANMKINECKNLIDEYLVLGIGGVLIDEVSRINLKQDQINLQVKSSYYNKSEVDEKIENVDIGLVVRNVEVMYYSSTSSSSLEDGEWKNSVPTIERDRYIWSKTVTIYSDESTSETEPICITNNNNYTWIKYSDNPDGTDMYDIPTDDTLYIGIATNRETDIESNNPLDYVWSKFRGSDGVGIKILGEYESIEELNEMHSDNNNKGDTYVVNGFLYTWTGDSFQNVGQLKGEDGTTFYTWIRYSDNSDGSNMYDVPNNNTLYIGIATNKETITESDNPLDYKWSKFKGENGSDGKGIVGIVDYYKVHTLDTGITNETEGFSTNIPQMDEVNKYLWAYEIIAYTDDSITKTSARVIGVFGADGKGIKEIIEYYAVSDSNSIAPTNFDTIVPLFDDVNIYLWNYEEIFYTDETSVASSKRVIGVKGEKGDTGKGIKNIVSEFYLSTSKDEQINGEWVETPPQWQTGTYIWTRSKIIYEDDTFEYSTPICDTTWENISDLQDQIDKNKEQIETTIERVSDIDISLDGITSKVTKTEETITNINGQVTSIESRMTSAEEKITDEAIINTVSSTYSTKSEVSTVSQTANKINWIIKSGTSSSNMQLTDNALDIIADSINIDGYVTFTNLSTSGQTTINGANIKSGTIRGVEIISSLTDTTNRVKMVGDGHYYYSSTKQAGEIHYDSNGAGTLQSAKDRFLIGSNNGYVLKLKSSGNMSLETTSNGTIYMMNNTQIDGHLTIDGGSSGSGWSILTTGYGTFNGIQANNTVTIDAELYANGSTYGKDKNWSIMTTGYGTFKGLETTTLSCSSTSSFASTMTVNATANLYGTVNGKDSKWSITSTGYGRFDGGLGTSTLSCSSTSSFTGKGTFNGGIGTTTLTCSSTSTFNNTMTVNANANLNGTVTGKNDNWAISSTGYGRFNAGTGTSDERLKTDIKYVNVDTQTIGEDGLVSPNVNITTVDMHEFVETLPMVSFRYKTDKEVGEDVSHYGFIAQEVLYTKVGSELIRVPKNSNDYPYLTYYQNNFTAFICGALQEEIRQRKTESEILNNTIISLEEKIKDLEDKLNNQ